MLSEETSNFAVLDDDVLSVTNFMFHYRTIQKTSGIVGGNGHIGIRDPNRTKLPQPRNYGPRLRTQKGDFVSHAWFFDEKSLADMWSIEPITLDMRGGHAYVLLSHFKNWH